MFHSHLIVFEQALLSGVQRGRLGGRFSAMALTARAAVLGALSFPCLRDGSLEAIRLSLPSLSSQEFVSDNIEVWWC